MIIMTLLATAAETVSHASSSVNNTPALYSLVREIMALFCLACGLFFMFVGALGVFRLPDVFHRMHAASKCSTLGLLGLMLGSIFALGTLGIITKAILTVIFAFVAIPVGTHLLAKAALKDGAPQWSGTIKDEWSKSKTAPTDMD